MRSPSTILAACALVFASAALHAQQPQAASTEPAAQQRLIVKSDGAETELIGAVVAEAADGTLLVRRSNGSVVLVMPGELVERTPLEEEFRLLDADALARDLMAQTDLSFQITRTEHYVICSNSSSEYAKFCGRLLELVYQRFEDFFSDHPSYRRYPASLPVIVFARTEQLQEFARRQHPDVDFSDVPGYYSVRDNQIMLQDLSGNPRIASQSAIRQVLRKMPRQMATVVHEAVHQLAFNHGLQERMADNPMWLSEGLSLYFETGSDRSTLLWSRPGVVNPVHQPAFVQLAESGRLPISLRELVRSEAFFQDSAKMPQAYAESWALTTYLINRERAGFDRLFELVSRRHPLQQVSMDQKLEEFEAAIGKSTDEIESEMIRYIRRLRVPR